MTHTRRLTALLVLALALAGAGLAYAAAEGSVALATSDVSATVTFAQARQSVMFDNRAGTQTITIKLWEGCDTPAAITTSTSGVFRVPAGAVNGATFPATGCGIGYIGFGHITGAGLNNTSVYTAQ
jgi:hypothetical protein